MSDSGSPLQLAYFFSPDTVAASAAGANPSVLDLTVMISNPGLTPVTVTHITVEIPTGQEISGDISTATGLPSPVYDTTIPWSIVSTSVDTLTIRPRQGVAAPVTGPILFSLPGIQVNETPGTVYPVITEFYPPPTPKATDDSTYPLVKLPSDTPVTSFLVNPAVLTNLDAQVTLTWTCSAQGQQDSFGLRIASTRSSSPASPTQIGSPTSDGERRTAAPSHLPALQLHGCGTSGECYTAAEGAAGVPYGPVSQTTTFALDVLRPNSSGELVLVTTLYATAQVTAPSFSPDSLLVPSPSGQLVRAHWIAYNAMSCSIVVDGNTVLTGAPTDTYLNGFPILLGPTPSTHLLEVIAHGVNQDASAPHFLGEVNVAPIAPVTIEDGPAQVAITPRGTAGFVMSMIGYDALTPIDLTTTPPKAATRIHTGAGAFVMGLTPDGRRLLVLSEFPSLAMLVDVASFQVVSTLETLPGGNAMAFTPDSAYAIASNNTDHLIYLIDIAAGQVDATIATVAAPTDLAITPDGTLALVLSGATGDLGLVDLRTYEAAPPIPTGVTQGWITITPDGTKAVLVDNVGSSVSLVDLDARAVVASGLDTGGNNSQRAVITPDGMLALVHDRGAPQLTIVDLAAGIIAATIPLSTPSGGVVVTPDGLVALVLLPRGSVVAVDLPTRSIRPLSLMIGPDAYTFALAPESMTLIAPSNSQNAVWVI